MSPLTLTPTATYDHTPTGLVAVPRTPRNCSRSVRRRDYILRVSAGACDLVLNADWERLTSRKRGIVLAADVDTLDALKQLTDAAAEAPDVVAIKVGVTLALRHGLATVAKAVTANSGLAVVYDHQKAGTDIPAMGRPFARACRDAGVHAAIIFPLAGPRTLEAFVTGAQEQGLVALVGLAMTHQEYLASEGGYIVDSAPEAICSLALALKVRDFVLPGTKPQLIAKFTNTLLAGTGARIFMPGVGSQGGTVASAVGAASPLAAFPIIGSAVYAAPNPSAALSSFAAELTS